MTAEEPGARAAGRGRGRAAGASQLAEVAVLFLRLGVTAFGGPAAHVAIMEEEVVRRRGWVSPERFLDLLGASNLIPGPSSTELAIFLGYEQAGAAGLVAAGACFILPAAVLVGAMAWAYVKFGALPQVAAVLYGVKPVVIAIIVQALWSLAPKAVKRSTVLGVLGAGACAAFALGADAIAVLLVAGAASAALRAALTRGARPSSSLVGLPILGALTGGAASAVPVSLGALFLNFLKAGAVVFGSGYVLLAFLRADLVDRLHWLSESELLDAVAVGQVTPGPVFTTATFIGYVVGARSGQGAGVAGAVAATVGIFLPGFLLVAIARPVVARIRSWPALGAFLDGVNVAALALMAVVAASLGRAAIVDPLTFVIAIASAVALIRFKVNTTWLVAAGAVCGVLARR